MPASILLSRVEKLWTNDKKQDGMTRWLDKFQQNHELNFSAIYFELIITHPTEKKDVFCGYAAATPVDKRSIHLCINWKHNGCFFHAPFPLWKIFSWSCWNSNISIYQSIKLKRLFGYFSCIKRCRWRYCCQLTKYSLNLEKGLKYFACYTRVVMWPHTQLGGFWSRENHFCDYSQCTYRIVLSLTQRWAVVCDHGGTLFQSKWRIYFSNKLMERFIRHFINMGTMSGDTD